MAPESLSELNLLLSVTFSSWELTKHFIKQLPSLTHLGEEGDTFAFIFCFCVSFLFFLCRTPLWIKSFKHSELKTLFYLNNLNNSTSSLLPSYKVSINDRYMCDNILFTP